MAVTGQTAPDACTTLSLGTRDSLQLIQALCFGECTAQHQREKAERHFVPKSEQRHVVPLEEVWT